MGGPLRRRPVVGIGSDTLLLQAGRTPTDPAGLDALVAEHHAFCPDGIDQGLPAEEYRAGLAAQQPDRGVWAFWWD
ncbi:DUF4253 domain-containing protein [Desertihabitans brevis]|uniref:DUF4253 domain-containing protein n=1 Tax=Desertihabitans brevis TaxID=2268447 RepID=A0A367YT30_9ACTN|nr:DUF4253 domain-containing protein [Desertihabitans brevis]